jgi:hypothetical protein
LRHARAVSRATCPCVHTKGRTDAAGEHSYATRSGDGVLVKNQ